MNFKSSSVRLALLLAALVVAPAAAYRAGDTVRFAFVPRDAAGVAADVSWIKCYIYKAGACIDSTLTDAAGIEPLDLAGTGTLRTLEWDWQVPAGEVAPGLANYSGVLRAVVRYGVSGIVQDEGLPSPSEIPVNFSVLDTILVEVSEDLYAQQAAANVATVTPGAYGAEVITKAGQPAADARVYLQRENTPSPLYTVRFDISDATGSYVLPVAVSPTGSNTFYLWAWKDGAWLEDGAEIVIP